MSNISNVIPAKAGIPISSPMNVAAEIPAFAGMTMLGMMLACPSISFADDTATTVPPVVISATRVPTPASEVASSVTVITSDDIEAKQEVSLPDVLGDVPGLSMVQTGGEGGKRRCSCAAPTRTTPRCCSTASI